MITALKKIYAFSGHWKGVLKKSVVFSLLHSIFDMFQIGALFLILNGLMEGIKGQDILFAFLLLLAGVIGKIVCSYISDFSQTRVGYFMCADKRIHIGDRMKYMPMGYFNSHSLGNLTSTVTTTISDVENNWYMSGDTLGELQLTWYNNIDPNETVEIVNTLWQRANAGETVFYDIYTEEEKAEDPDKEDTGLLFFKGDPGAKFAVCNAGGGFAYVGAMQDSFPHALEISKRGYNAFALIYRPGAQTACEDLARAISFIFEHTEELEVDTEGYSLWGGSAGARMAAWLGSYGPAAFGGDDLPQPSAVIMQYTGHSDYTENDPPTFACVGESDGIANWRTMQRRIEALDTLGIPTEFHHYPGLPHGFGLGTGTVAEGWLDEAAQFWEAQM